jgi:hypothetical protein
MNIMIFRPVINLIANSISQAIQVMGQAYRAQQKTASGGKRPARGIFGGTYG